MVFTNSEWPERELPEDWDIWMTSIKVEEVAGEYQLLVGGAVVET